MERDPYNKRVWNVLNLLRETQRLEGRRDKYNQPITSSRQATHSHNPSTAETKACPSWDPMEEIWHPGKDTSQDRLIKSESNPSLSTFFCHPTCLVSCLCLLRALCLLNTTYSSVGKKEPLSPDILNSLTRGKVGLLTQTDPGQQSNAQNWKQMLLTYMGVHVVSSTYCGYLNGCFQHCYFQYIKLYLIITKHEHTHTRNSHYSGSGTWIRNTV